MIRIFLPLVCAALGLVAASCSQAEGPFAPAGAPASPQPGSRGPASAAMANQPDPEQASSPQDAPAPPSSQAPHPESIADANPDAPTSTPAERRASTLIGMPVQSADGNPLGEVKDIVFDRQGQATHLVIAYGTESQAAPGEIPDDGKPVPSSPDGKLTAIPWDAALASIRDGRLVLDSGQLQGAPSFTPDAWPNFDDPAWSATTDAYWRKAVRAAIAAHPGAPIDSTTRQRGRPGRDGDDDNPY